MENEQKPESVLKKVEVLKEGTTIKIELPVAFYYRLNQLMLEMFPTIDKDKFLQLIEKVSKNDIETDRMAYHLSTLIKFLVLIEDNAREQGHTEYANYNLETGERTPIESPQ